MLQAFAATAAALQRNPQGVLERTLQYHQQQLALSASWMERLLGQTPAPVATPAKDDKRFTHESWQLPFYDLLKQTYLLASQYVTEVVGSAQTDLHTFTPQQKMQAEFYTRQFVELLSPSNVLLTNPEALSTAMATQGESLLQGFKNLAEDMQRGKISMTDKRPYVVGETIAITKGEVVFRNRLCEVIQYTPTTAKVHPTPLVICPPWINRFYVLDLQPQNSLVKFLVDSGFQVFMVSWKNPDASYRDVGFEDYIKEGLLEGIDTACAVTGAAQANVVGYCIGGTMVFAGLAALQAKGDTRVKSATFLTTLSDFANAGELKVFTDDAQVSALEAQMQRDGVLDGKTMASTFSLLRANDLVWNFVVQNYMLGKQPLPFDILVWNDDPTRMPAAMHSWYLRKLYVENALAKPNGVTLLGEKIDLGKLKLPMYMLSALNDHITPWESCFAPYAKMASGNKRFAVTKAGHVAGVVNPPTPAGKPVKRSFWVGEIGAASAIAPENWLKTATETPDSWWPDYANWLQGQSGEPVAAPKTLGGKGFKPLCAAPGVYVKEA
jgi:polyhydroxyalkanoate synthase